MTTKNTTNFHSSFADRRCLPATVEFRCGSDLDALQKYFTGPYAYWLSAGIDANADAQTIDNVIDLFVTENLSGE